MPTAIWMNCWEKTRQPAEEFLRSALTNAGQNAFFYVAVLPEAGKGQRSDASLPGMAERHTGGSGNCFS